MLVIYGAQLFAGQMLTFSSPSSVFFVVSFLSRTHSRKQHLLCFFVMKEPAVFQPFGRIASMWLHNAAAGTRCNLHHAWDAQTLANHTLVWLLVASHSSLSWFFVCVCVHPETAGSVPWTKLTA